MKTRIIMILAFALILIVSCLPNQISAEPQPTLPPPATIQAQNTPVTASTVSVTINPTASMGPPVLFLTTETPSPTPIDPLLVRVVDKNHPVDQAFLDDIEKHLVNIDARYQLLYGGEPSPILNNLATAHEIAVTNLCHLLKASADQGSRLTLRNGYRDLATQKMALEQTDFPNRIAQPGQSQHHTGLAFDFTSSQVGNLLLPEFSDTPEYRFLQEHASEFGFVESFVASHDGMINEPWHWLYLGPELTQKYLELKTQGVVKDPFEFQALYPQP